MFIRHGIDNSDGLTVSDSVGVAVHSTFCGIEGCVASLVGAVFGED